MEPCDDLRRPDHRARWSRRGERSFQLARENWQAETGGLGVLQLALIVPMFLLYVTGRLLAGGHLHSTAAKGAFALVLVAGFAVAVAAGVVRQVFAIELYRTAEA